MEKQHILLEYDKYTKKYKNLYGENTVILMHLGSFYEICAVLNDNDNDTYGELDIYNISNNILNIAVATKKNKYKNKNNGTELTYYQAGFPLNSKDKYIPILLENNYTIVIVDQVTEPPNPDRKVTSIISPGIYIPDENSKNIDNNYLMSIYIEKYKKNKFSDMFYKSDNGFILSGISVIDLSTGKNNIHNIKYNEDINYWSEEIFRLINFYNPSEIIIHTENYDIDLNYINNKWEINHNCIHINHFKDPIYKKVTYHETFLKRIFNINKMISPLDYLNLTYMNEVSQSYVYMLLYIHEHKSDLLQNIEHPKEYIESENLILTSNSIRQLNIIGNYSYYKGRNDSLLEICNKTLTPMGKRLLKNRLLYPLTDIDLINERYNKIELFIKNNFYDNIRNNLKYISDIEKLTRLMGIGELQPYGLLSLYLSSEYISIVCKLIRPNSIYDFYEKYDKHIDNYLKFIDEIKHIFNFKNITNIPITNTEKSIINKGYDENLDFLIIRIEELKNILKFICDKLSIILKIEDGIKFNSDREKWFIYSTNKRSNTLKDNINKLKNKNLTIDVLNIEFLEKYKTISLDEIKLKKKDGSNSIIDYSIITIISNKLIEYQNELCKINIKLYRNFINIFYKKYNEDFKNISEFISDIDFCSNGAYLAINNNYNKPIIKTGTSYINCKQIRHPIVEKINKDIEYITNDIILGKDKKGILLFGTNACGKSTFMKAIGLNIVLAQAGLYTASESFEYSPYNKIFTRILNNDNIFKSQSTFVVEIDELRSILTRSDEKSLVLGDELCSGTETISALSIVSAGLYKLSQLNSTYIFTSHLHQLNKLDIIKNINTLDIYHLKIENVNGELIYDRKLCKGPGPSIYGLKVCEALGLDSEFLYMANKVQSELLNENTTLKLSPYNKNVIIDLCEICGNPAEETDHINEQKFADENGMIKHFHKNSKHNLVGLCKECHKKKNTWKFSN